MADSIVEYGSQVIIGLMSQISIFYILFNLYYNMWSRFFIMKWKTVRVMLDFMVQYMYLGTMDNKLQPKC